MNKTIAADLYRHFGLQGFKGLIRGLCYPGFRYTYLYRKVNIHGKRSFPGLLYRMLLRRYRFKYGFEINPDAKIGDGFYLTSHCGTVVIGPVTMGKNCNVGHCVTIGRGITGEKKGRPTLGDNVWIGTGAVIVGKINIGNNVLIAPNSFVNFDVPDNSLIIGNPGTIISKDDPVEGFINYRI
jgi:serine O-acetyltransferase